MKKCFLGILALALMLGMAVIGCGGDENDDEVSTSSTNDNPKVITITGLEGIPNHDDIMENLSEIDVELYVLNGFGGTFNSNIVTYNYSKITEADNLINFQLKVFDNWDNWDNIHEWDNFVGTGFYYIFLKIDSHAGGEMFYTNGKTKSELGITDFNVDWEKLPKFEIKNTVSSIDFSKFKEYDDIH